MIPQRWLRQPGAGAYVALAPLLLVALSHHVLWRTASAYLFHDIAASRSTAALTFALAAAIGGALTWLRKPSAAWAHGFVLTHALLCALAQVGAFVLFASCREFPWFVSATAVLLGLVSGALLASFPALIASAARDRSAVLDMLSVEVLAPSIAGLVVLLAISHRAGPLRTGIALAAISASLVAVGAASTLRKGVARLASDRFSRTTSLAVASIPAEPSSRPSTALVTTSTSPAGAFGASYVLSTTSRPRDVPSHDDGGSSRGGSARSVLRVQIASAVVAIAIASMLPFVQPLTPSWEVALAPDPVVLSAASPAGRVTLTSGRGAFQLFTDGTLRASSIDGYRFRESLVHPLFSGLATRSRVLVLGGGDGQAVREILRYPDVGSVVVIEPIAPLVRLAREQPFLLSENANSLADARVHVEVADPMVWLRTHADAYDAIVVDLGEPTGPTRGKLFTTYFFSLVRDHLTPRGSGVIATVSPLNNRKAYWSILASLDEAALRIRSYRADIPTFGVVGFSLFGRDDPAPPYALALPPGLVFLDAPQLGEMFRLAPDESRVEAEANRLYHQVFLKYRAE